MGTTHRLILAPVALAGFLGMVAFTLAGVALAFTLSAAPAPVASFTTTATVVEQVAPAPQEDDPTFDCRAHGNGRCAQVNA